MNKYAVDFSDFKLPFLKKKGYVLEYDIRCADDMVMMLPVEAITIGHNKDEIENWTTWTTDDIFIVLALNNKKWDWALFRISWDDNWGCWAWTSDCRIKGDFKSHELPAAIMLRECFIKWNMDIKSNGYELFDEMVNNIKY